MNRALIKLANSVDFKHPPLECWFRITTKASSLPSSPPSTLSQCLWCEKGLAHRLDALNDGTSDVMVCDGILVAQIGAYAKRAQPQPRVPPHRLPCGPTHQLCNLEECTGKGKGCCVSGTVELGLVGSCWSGKPKLSKRASFNVSHVQLTMTMGVECKYQCRHKPSNSAHPALGGLVIHEGAFDTMSSSHPMYTSYVGINTRSQEQTPVTMHRWI